MSTRAGALVASLATLLALTACSSGGDPVSKDKTPEQVLTQAKTTLDGTSGLQITLGTKDLPDGIDGLVGATGIGTHAPAFQGSITVRTSGFEPEVPVIAVDGKVFAQLPLTTGWSDIDPADYGAPDPAELLSPDSGFSALLPATTGVVMGDSVRGGQDNREVLTEYTGTVPGSTVKNIIPAATGDFDASYSISADGELRQAVLTGDFYGGGDTITYTIGFDAYGAEKDITAP